MLGLGTGINKLSSAEASSIASRSGGYLLDTYSGAAAAYSLRQLSSSYSGNAVKVRRSSDNTETDIGFVGGELDTASLSSFAGAGDAFVVSWFDQSGNSNDATQTTTANQPKIVSSGAVIVENGKPAVEFDGSNDGLLTSGTTLMYESDFTALFLARTNNITSTGVFISGGSGGSGSREGRIFFHLNDRLTQGFLGASTGSNLQTITANTQNLYYSENTGFHTGETYETKVYIDGGNLATATGTGLTSPTGTSAFAIGINGHLNSGTLDGKIQEVILFPSVDTNDRTGIETNINTFYSIY